MVKIEEITGRLGNQMFLTAFLYAYARDNNLPLVDDALGYYYQDYKLFDHHRDNIKKLFGTGIVKSDYVAIHVRRGDYVGNPFYVDLMKTDYYQKAIAEFPNETFVVFSDDKDWCMKQDVFKDCEFNIWGDEITDFNRMAGAKGIIMANSSYSWWCAYLSDAKVIAPKAWHHDGVIRTKLLPEWKQI